MHSPIKLNSNWLELNDLHVCMVIGCVDLLWSDFDWKSPRTMFVNGFTKLSTWIQRICVCEWIYEVKHLNPNEFAKSGCMLALIPRILMALGERPSMFPSTGWDEGGWFCYDVWLRVVGDLCNVYGTVALSCVLMLLEGRFNITNIGMIPKRIFFIWFEPDHSKLLSQAITDGHQINGPVRLAIYRCQ